MLITKAYKFRFYPTSKQIDQLLIDFGCARFAYNEALDAMSFCYRALGRSVKVNEVSKALTELKQDPDYAWLKDANSTVIIQKLRDLDTAFKNFFAGRAAYPNFKSKKGPQSVRYQLDQRNLATTYNTDEQFLKLPKLGVLKLRWSQSVKGIPKMITVSRDAVGDYFVSLACEIDIDTPPKGKGSVGIDLGVSDVVVTSDGGKSGNPKFIAKYQAKLRHAQKTLSRRVKGSGRWHRARILVAKIQRKIARCRLDFQHKLTTTLVRTYDLIALEDLNVKGMVKNHKLAKAISDSGLGELVRQLEYKAQWYGREIVQIGRWVRSTGVCPDCNLVGDKLPLSIRQWTCTGCGAEHDRDIAAAQMILKIATAGRAGIARGEIDRCQDAKRRPRQVSSVKREFAVSGLV